MRNKFILLLSITILTILVNCSKKYDILHAPSTTKKIVDYGGVLRKSEENYLKMRSDLIFKKYNVRIYVLTVTSSCGKFDDYDYMAPRESDILNLWEKHDIEKYFILSYSIQDRYFGIPTSKEAQKLPVFKELAPIIQESVEVFLKEKNYFKFFKFIFDRLEEELSKNYV